MTVAKEGDKCDVGQAKKDVEVGVREEGRRRKLEFQWVVIRKVGHKCGEVFHHVDLCSKDLFVDIATQVP